MLAAHNSLSAMHVCLSPHHLCVLAQGSRLISINIATKKKKVQAHSNPNPGNDKTLSISLGLKYGWSTSRHQCECHRRKKQWWVFPARRLKAPGAQLNLKTDFPYRKAERKDTKAAQEEPISSAGHNPK